MLSENGSNLSTIVVLQHMGRFPTCSPPIGLFRIRSATRRTKPRRRLLRRNGQRRPPRRNASHRAAVQVKPGKRCRSLPEIIDFGQRDNQTLMSDWTGERNNSIASSKEPTMPFSAALNFSSIKKHRLTCPLAESEYAAYKLSNAAG